MAISVQEDKCVDYCFLAEGCSKSIFQTEDSGKRAKFFEEIFILLCELQRFSPDTTESLREQLKFTSTFEENAHRIFEKNCFTAPRGLRKYCQ